EPDFLVRLLTLRIPSAEAHGLEPVAVEVVLRIDTERTEVARAFPERVGSELPIRAVRVGGRCRAWERTGPTRSRIPHVDRRSRIDLEADTRLVERGLGPNVRVEEGAAPHLFVIRVRLGELRIELEVEPIRRIPLEVETQIFGRRSLVLADAERRNAQSIRADPGIAGVRYPAGFHQASGRHHDFTIAGLHGLTAGAATGRDAGRRPVFVVHHVRHGETSAKGAVWEPLGRTLEAVDHVFDARVLQCRAYCVALPLRGEVVARAVSIHFVRAELEARHVGADVLGRNAVEPAGTLCLRL